MRLPTQAARVHRLFNGQQTRVLVGVLANDGGGAWHVYSGGSPSTRIPWDNFTPETGPSRMGLVFARRDTLDGLDAWKWTNHPGRRVGIGEFVAIVCATPTQRGRN